MPMIGNRSKYNNKLQYNRDIIETRRVIRVESRVESESYKVETWDSSRVASHQNVTQVATRVASSQLCNLLLWLKDFLHNRSQVTQLGDAYSSENSLVSGMVQGSCLGSLLFVIYINDVGLTDALRSDCTCQVFTVDLKLYSVANIADDNTLVIQDSLDKLCLWSDLWQLTISHKKCCVMFVSLFIDKNTHRYIVFYGTKAKSTHRC